MLYKTVCSFSCNEGFEAKGSVVRRCTENGTWSGTDLVCDEGIHTGSTLYPAGRKPNAFLDIFGKGNDFLKPANLKSLFCLLLVLYLNDTNAACLHNQGQGFIFLKQSLTLEFSRALYRGTRNMFSCVFQGYLFYNIRYRSNIHVFSWHTFSRASPNPIGYC